MTAATPPSLCQDCVTPPEPTRLCGIHRRQFEVEGWRADQYSDADYARLSWVKPSPMEIPMSHGGFSSSALIERIAHLVPDQNLRFHEAFILTRAEATEWWELIHDQSPTMAKVAQNIGSYLGWSLTPSVVARFGLEFQWWRPHIVAFWAHSGADLEQVPGWCMDSRNPMPVRATTDALRRLLPGWIDPDPEL